MATQITTVTSIRRTSICLLPVVVYEYGIGKMYEIFNIRRTPTVLVADGEQQNL